MFCFLLEFARLFSSSRNYLRHDLWLNEHPFECRTRSLAVLWQEVTVHSTNHNGRNPKDRRWLRRPLSSLSGFYPACGYANPVIKFVGEPSYKLAGRLKPLGVLSSCYTTKHLSDRWTVFSDSDWLLLLEMCSVPMLRWTLQTYLAAGPSTDSCHHT